VSGQADCIRKGFGNSRYHQGRGRIHKDDIAARSGLALEETANQRGVFPRGSPLKHFQRCAGQSEIFRRQDEAPYRSLMHLGDLRFSRQRDFVETTEAMDNECLMNAKFDKCCCH